VHERFGQHRYDANQHFFAGLNAIQRGKSFGHRNIRAGRAFDGRAACTIKEFGSLASLSSTGKLTALFCSGISRRIRARSVTAGLKWPPEIGPNEKISGTNVAPVQFCRFQWGNTLFRVAILEVLPTFGRSFNGLARGAWTAAE